MVKTRTVLCGDAKKGPLVLDPPGGDEQRL